jgi:hypothetical protein
VRPGGGDARAERGGAVQALQGAAAQGFRSVDQLMEQIEAREI